MAADIESNIWAQRCLKAGNRGAASQQQQQVSGII
jgi:hypothetical protein